MAQSPKSPEYEKIRKNTKIPHPRLGPENTKKIPKKYENRNFGAIFVVFGIVFVYSGPNPGWLGGGFCIFFVISRISGIQGISGSVPPAQDSKITHALFEFSVLHFLKFPTLIFKSAFFPHRVSQCALLAPVVSVRPQELAKLTLTTEKFGGSIVFGIIYLHLHS